MAAAMDDPSNQPTDRPPNRMRMGVSVFLATGAYVGLIPVAPGTFGALWGLLLTWAMIGAPLYLQLLIIVAVAAVGVPICSAAAKKLGSKDPSEVIWDEISSVPMTFLLVPAAKMTVLVLIVGFALNRAFDIVKPPPLRQLEHLPGGLGIMADDWAAGVYSFLVLHLLLYFELL